MNELRNIIEKFAIRGTVSEIKPLGEGLINDTYKVLTAEADQPDYVLQRVNHVVFPDVDMVMRNIDAVTSHIRKKLEQKGEKDIDRKVLTFIPLKDDSKKLYALVDGKYWRIMIFIPDAITKQAVNPESRRQIDARAEEMCKAERMGREGILPKRVCHCDTKVNNMMFDKNDNVLCVIDLDTVMPNFIFSDYGDFLRTGANVVAEDCPDMDKVQFNIEIFKAFTEGYLSSASSFLTRVEIENLPYAVKLFPYMQCVRFLWDYLSGDKYWKCQYPEHNFVRSNNQLHLLLSIEAHEAEMKDFIGKIKEKR